MLQAATAALDVVSLVCSRGIRIFMLLIGTFFTDFHTHTRRDKSTAKTNTNTPNPKIHLRTIRMHLCSALLLGNADRMWENECERSCELCV